MSASRTDDAVAPDRQRPSPEEPPRTGRRSRAAVWLLAVVAVILLGAVLRAAFAVVVPVVAAAFVALVVAPVSHAVKRHVPRRLGRLGEAAAMGLVLLVLLAFFAGILLAAQQIVNRFGGLAEVAEMLPVAGDAQEGTGSAEGDGATGADEGDGERAAANGDGDPEDLWPTVKAQARALVGGPDQGLLSYASGYASGVLNSLGALVAALTLIFFLVLLMLVEAPRWRAKLETLVPRDSRPTWNDTLLVAAKSFRWYLLVRTLLGALTATLYVAWLWLFGVDLLFVWFLLTFLLSYIPTIGSIISGLIPIAYAFVTKDVATTLFVAGGILAIEQVMGNYVDPRMLGKQLSLSPIVTFVSLVFWGWMWGVAGALLAVPLTVLFVIVASRISALRPVALLLSDECSMQDLEARTTP